jgi:hypothetical protein
MQTSIFLAKLMGRLFAVLRGGLLVKQSIYRVVVHEFLASLALTYYSGLLALLAGLAIVNLHNVWGLGGPVIITVFGWLTLSVGILRMVFPDGAKAFGAAIFDAPGVLLIASVAQLGLGLPGLSRRAANGRARDLAR